MKMNSLLVGGKPQTLWRKAGLRLGALPTPPCLSPAQLLPLDAERLLAPQGAHSHRDRTVCVNAACKELRAQGICDDPQERTVPLCWHNLVFFSLESNSESGRWDVMKLL